jgi:hypothetical protein
MIEPSPYRWLQQPFMAGGSPRNAVGRPVVYGLQENSHEAFKPIHLSGIITMLCYGIE